MSVNSAIDVTDAIEVPGIEFGPAMMALPSDKWRNFALYYVLEGCSGAEAVRKVGFCKPDSSDLTRTKQAYRLTSDSRMQSAILELGRKYLSSLVADSIKTLREVMADPTARNADRVKAAAVVLDRTLPAHTVMDVNHHHIVDIDHAKAALESLRFLKSMQVPREVLIEQFGHSGLDRYERALAEEDARVGKVKVIEGRVEAAN